MLDSNKTYSSSTVQVPLHSSDALRKPSDLVGRTVRVHGFLGKRKDLSEKLSFAPLYLHSGAQPVQIVSREETSKKAHQTLKTIRPYSAISMLAHVALRRQPKSRRNDDSNSKIHDSIEPIRPESDLSLSSDPKNNPWYLKRAKDLEQVELILEDIQCVGSFPDDITISDDVKFGPDQRHLQIRFDRDLSRRLEIRSRVVRAARDSLQDFQEVETPILFKSTPEGAREFLVPTRRPGYAYALPQSPQQYKQILMASGVRRYFQIARCFRDEDLRADRQPEFTQIDLEMAFSDGEVVMHRMEAFIKDLFNRLRDQGMTVPEVPFRRMTYDRAMTDYGVDKPDLRIKARICRIDGLIPKSLVSMLTSLSDPIVEGLTIRLDGNAQDIRAFVKEFMDSSEALDFNVNPDGAPGVFIYDPRQPLQGLQAFGHAGAETLCKTCGLQSDGIASEDPGLEEGDLLLVQARPNEPHSGGSTALGRLRTAVHRAAVAKGLIRADHSQRFLWITDFPLFTPNNDSDPGQGGTAGFSATHHPFTAPKSAADVDIMFTNPLKAKADHYDLVVNGVELGGGSRRIHDSEVQELVMRDILKMQPERIRDFSHLFEVLRAGCPPHAGIALGLDRLVAVMLGQESVRDVIAFPKSGKGEDLLVGGPSLMTEQQQETYHIKVMR
ncbi:MAG: hypothetical protein M1818_002934 [Claussenomyces sp. TS43310]|nr:MAG: hypothetical protein M1818_002934 [Claussenomyces sp. TS43310]